MVSEKKSAGNNKKGKLTKITGDNQLKRGKSSGENFTPRERRGWPFTRRVERYGLEQEYQGGKSKPKGGLQILIRSADCDVQKEKGRTSTRRFMKKGPSQNREGIDTRIQQGYRAEKKEEKERYPWRELTMPAVD